MKISFNPCFTGSGSFGCSAIISRIKRNSVSILVLLEAALLDLF